jgi:hypothetical protein
VPQRARRVRKRAPKALVAVRAVALKDAALKVPVAADVADRVAAADRRSPN